MDVSTSTPIVPTQPASLPPELAVSCDICGYPRIGLPETARCPECGQSPPSMVGDDSVHPMMTAGRRARLRCVCAGLALLLVSYLIALRVILIMPIETESLTAVNVPVPKIAAVALLQRSIGNRPGPWGVEGMTAVLASLAAVWLLTEPQHGRGDVRGGTTSLRFLTRWASIFGTGAVLGAMLSGNSIHFYNSSTREPLTIAIILGELPAATLLYLYLRRVAREVHDEKAARMFDLSALAVPLLMFFSLLILLHPHPQGEKLLALRIFCAGYGALAIGCGLLATAAAAHLIASTARAAFSEPIEKLLRGLMRTANLLPHLAAIIRTNAQRFSVASGIALWLALLPWMICEAGSYTWRRGYGGDVPYINLPGPKIAFAALSMGSYGQYFQFGMSRDSILLLFLEACAVWMMTRAPGQETEQPRSRIARLAARWGMLVAAGMALSWALSFPTNYGSYGFQNPISPTAIIITGIIAGEAPIAALLYWHLSMVAARFDLPRLRKSLAWLALVCPIMIVAPLGMVLLSHFHKAPIPATLMAGIVMSTELFVAMLGLSALVTLTWNLFMRGQQPPSEVPSAGNDSTGARAVAE